MIDEDGNLKCDSCNKKLAECRDLKGRLEMVCPRCKRFCVFDSTKLDKVLGTMVE